MGGIFKRIEKKYLLDKSQYDALMEQIGERLLPDEFGLHTVCNVYFDTKENDLIRRSIEKPKYKEKLRLRSYGIPQTEDTVYLEMKKKYKGTVYKRRVEMPLSVATKYLYQGEYPAEYDCQILKEIDYMIHFYPLYPALYLAYDRQAFLLKEDEELRFTVDRKIRSREERINLLEGDEGETLFEEEKYLIEIKTPYALPVWFANTLSELEIYSNSFSKYGKIYEKRGKDKERLEKCLQVL